MIWCRFQPPLAQSLRAVAECGEGAERRGKTNFFERRVGEYQRSGVMSSLQQRGAASAGRDDYVFTLNEDF